MKDGFVLDASSAASWFLPDETDAAAQSALRAVESGSVPLVACHWHLEVSQALAGACRRKRISPRELENAFGLLRELPVEVDGPPGARAFVEIRSLCGRHQLSFYDALYLDLSIRTGLPLATGDSSLAKAARKEGVSLLEQCEGR